MAGAYGVSWAIWAIALARGRHGVFGAAARALGTAGPTIAAAIEVRRGAHGEHSELAARWRRFPKNPVWLVVAVGVPMATVIGAAGFAVHQMDLTPGLRSRVTPGRIAATAAVAATVALPDGPLG